MSKSRVQPKDVDVLNLAGLAKDSETCVVEVKARDGSGNKSCRSFRIAKTSSLQQLREAWAKLWSIPAQAVGFEEVGRNRGQPCACVNPDLTPQKLQWGCSITVQAIPVKDEWAEADGAEAAGGEKQPQAFAKRVGKKVTKKILKKTAKKTAKAPLRPVARSAIRAAAEKRRKGQPKASGKPSGAAAKKDSKDVRGEPTSGEAKSKQAEKVVVEGPIPTDDEKICFEKPNPKRPGTAAFKRYQKYMKAKTVREMLKLGGERIDVQHDFRKGYMRRAGK